MQLELKKRNINIYMYLKCKKSSHHPPPFSFDSSDQSPMVKFSPTWQYRVLKVHILFSPQIRIKGTVLLSISKTHTHSIIFELQKNVMILINDRPNGSNSPSIIRSHYPRASTGEIREEKMNIGSLFARHAPRPFFRGWIKRNASELDAVESFTLS